MPSPRLLVAIAIVTALGTAGTTSQPAVWPGAAWTAATPESQGLASAPFDALTKEIQNGTYGYVDRLFVVRHGRAVVDKTFAQDYRAISKGVNGPIGCGEGCADRSKMHEFNYYHPNWHPYYQGRTVHTLQSVTKSIAAIAIGIAIGRGEITSVRTPLLSFFADRNLSGLDPRLSQATLADLLTMRSGIEWHEQDRPLNETNTTVQLEASRDWIAFTLSQPMDAAPGEKWAYNSGTSALMAAIIRTATGRHIDEYANEWLFKPIGIRDFHWKKTPTGHPDTEGGLYLAADDLARIGYLYLHDGEWNGKRVLPAGWVKDATTPHARGVAANWDYGYQWWLTSQNGAAIWAGRGFGGQLLIVIPSRDVVGVVNAWNVFGAQARNIFPAVVAAMIQ